MAARRGGVVVQVGNLPGGPLPVPLNPVMAKELDLRGSFRFDKEFAEAVGLIAEGRIDVLSLVTARRPLADAPARLPPRARPQPERQGVLTATA